MSNQQVQIVLDYPRQPYRPGDTLTGHISAASGLGFDHYEVSLHGVASVVTYSVKHDIASQAVAMLISETQKLTPLGSTRCKFEIAIPSSTVDTENVFLFKPRPFRRNPYISTSDARERMAKDNVSLACFERESGHSLPPSLPLAFVGSFVLGRLEGFAYIEYMVKVKALKRDGSQTFVPVAEHAVPFWFTPSCPAEEQIQRQIGGNERDTKQKTFTMKSKSLLSDTQPKARSFSGLLKMDSLSSAVPTFVWKATCSSPVYAHIGDALVFHLDLMPASDSTTTGPVVTKMPDIKVHKFQMVLQRCIRAHSNRLFTFETVVSDGQLLASPLTLPYQESRSKYDGLALEASPRHLNNAIIPDFKTFNLCISYQLKLKIEFSVAGQPLEWKYLVPIKIFPKRNPPTDPPAVNGLPEAQQKPNEDWGECLGPIVSSKPLLMALISRVDKTAMAVNSAVVALDILSLATGN